MAVLGDTQELPVSQDIGGLPQVIPDDPTPEPTSPTGGVNVELEDDVGSSSDFDDFDVRSDSDPNLPTYHDVTCRQSPLPPSYDSLLSPPHTPVGPMSQEVVPGPTKTLAGKLRTRRRKKKGYQPHRT